MVSDESEISTWLRFEPKPNAKTSAAGVLLPCAPSVLRYCFAGLSVVSRAMLDVAASELNMLPSEVDTLEDWVMVRCVALAAHARSDLHGTASGERDQ